MDRVKLELFAKRFVELCNENGVAWDIDVDNYGIPELTFTDVSSNNWVAVSMHELLGEPLPIDDCCEKD